MTAERDRDDRSEGARAPKDADRRLDEVLRDVAVAEDETSCDDADAAGFLERFPVAAREPQRPKDDD